MKVITFSRNYPAYHPLKGKPTYFLEKVLKSLDKGRNVNYYMCKCDKCGWLGMSNNCAGGGAIADTGDYFDPACKKCYSTDLSEPEDLGYYTFKDEVWSKHHTIRAGSRWNVGDVFSARSWSGKPYASKQIEIAEIEIKKVWPIGLRIRGDFKEFYSGDCDLTHTSIDTLARNDGLETSEFLSWFNKPFEGQIICWNERIDY